MTAQSIPKILSRLTLTALGAVFVIGLFSAGAAAEETAVVPDLKPLPDLSADIQISMFDRRGHTAVSKIHIERSGNIIRYEHRLLDPPELSIYDFDSMKEYRIYDSDKIYFETGLSDRMLNKVQRDGLLRFREYPQIILKRIVLTEDLIEGHPCDIVMMVRTVKDRKEFTPEYTWLWEARDLDRQPLRAAYFQSGDSLVVVNYTAVKTGTVEAALLKPPADFTVMNPY